MTIIPRVISFILATVLSSGLAAPMAAQNTTLPPVTPLAAPASPSYHEGDIVPAPPTSPPGTGISGPGAVHGRKWFDMQTEATGDAVKAGLIPNLKPLVPDMQLRDTEIILGGDGNYYMTGSSGTDIWDHNDGIELWESPDLKSWKYDGIVWSFDKDGTWEKDWRWHRKAVRAIWAPEIHYIKHLHNYFIVFSMPPGNRGILKSVTGKPEGPYVSSIPNDGYLHGGIDPTLFEDDDGTVYFTSGGGSHIYMMKDDVSGFAGEGHTITYEKPTDGSWTRSSVGQEGVSLFKRNGIYYLGGAAFYKGRYSSVVAISKNIYGPYTNWEEAVPCGGGTDYFQDKEGNWWDAFFGNDNQAPFRERPAIVKIDFDQQGLIHVAKDQPSFVTNGSNGN